MTFGNYKVIGYALLVEDVIIDFEYSLKDAWVAWNQAMDTFGNVGTEIVPQYGRIL